MDTNHASVDTPCMRYRTALIELGERYGSGIRALEALPAYVESDANTVLVELAQSFRMAPITIRDMHRLEPDFSVMPFVEAAARLCLCFSDGPGLLFVIADPLDARTRGCVDQRMRARPTVPYRWALATVGDLSAYLAAREKDVRAMDTLALDDAVRGASDTAALALTLQGISHDDSPIVRLLNSTIYDALKLQASDIHLECRAGGLTIKYRIDGVLSVVGRMEGRDLADQVLSRLKVISELDIAERRVPQDGRFKAQFAARDIDFRVSIMPNQFGEDAVLR
ncbi:general secretion pathway protein GspE, partial [Ralstonia solanacearum]